MHSRARVDTIQFGCVHSAILAVNHGRSIPERKVGPMTTVGLGRFDDDWHGQERSELEL
jgi:hypothetical protein